MQQQEHAATPHPPKKIKNTDSKLLLKLIELDVFHFNMLEWGNVMCKLSSVILKLKKIKVFLTDFFWGFFFFCHTLKYQIPKQILMLKRDKYKLRFSNYNSYPKHPGPSESMYKNMEQWTFPAMEGRPKLLRLGSSDYLNRSIKKTRTTAKASPAKLKVSIHDSTTWMRNGIQGKVPMWKPWLTEKKR